MLSAVCFQELKVAAESTVCNLQLNQHELELLKQNHIQFTDDSLKYQIHKWTADGYSMLSHFEPLS